MSLLITGGSGFLGLSLAQHLASLGEQVVLFDLAPPPEALRAKLGHPQQIHFVTGNILDEARLDEVILQFGVTRILHGAAITASLDREAREARRIYEVNLLGTICVAEASLRHGLVRMIHLGSGSVHGASVRQEGLLHPENDPPVPDSLYGISKLAAERTLLRYRATRGLDAAVARIGVAFGPWEYDTGLRDTLSIPHTLLALARQKIPARILTSVPNDWVHATDVAEALAKLLFAPRLGQAIYQISAGKVWDVQSFCEAIRAQIPSFEWRMVPNRSDANVGHLSPVPRAPFDVSAMAEEFGWKARYTGAESVTELIGFDHAEV